VGGEGERWVDAEYIYAELEQEGAGEFRSKLQEVAAADFPQLTLEYVRERGSLDLAMLRID
jgi:hypothetical protein